MKVWEVGMGYNPGAVCLAGGSDGVIPPLPYHERLLNQDPLNNLVVASLLNTGGSPSLWMPVGK